ncbi:MAG: hypothetical protein JSR37_04520 [Verrucomicrobia bacterium]|nr:hypothetical protein [Verrucomicrobiota bacterium]MBS0637077.1 hypothetical protein [Verrucomicrobiota bacterium]
MTLSFDACKQYAADIAESNLAEYGVTKYKNGLTSRVNDLCLKIGAFCEGDKKTHDKLSGEVVKAINELSSDEADRAKLHRYANSIISAASDYLNYTKHK